ncbi:OmpA family protein [Paracoccus suum]|uniref:OmpA family protein n=1 Tax=Paracoccus suum TaxID=2259340 RepID=A0A344PKM2_9RHOB|nr:OmpA family protein [Paracoccus suum]AXC49927.1 OmpA family protein [Paracoccus suum]
MNRLFRSTTAIAAILGIVTPTLLQAQVPIGLAQAQTQPVVVVPPTEALTDAEAAAAAAAATGKAPVSKAELEKKAKEAAKKAKEAAKEAAAEAKEAAKEADVAAKEAAKDGKSPIVVSPNAKSKAAAEDGDAPVVVAPGKAGVKAKADAKADAPVKAGAKATADAPVVVAPKDKPKADAKAKAEAEAPVVVAPAKPVAKANDAEVKAAADKAAAAKVAQEKAAAAKVAADKAAAKAAEASTPVVVAPAAKPVPEQPSPTTKPAIAVSPNAKSPDYATTKAPAEPVAVSPGTKAPDADALAEALAKKDGAKAPVVVAPAAKPAAATAPVVAKPAAGTGTTPVVVAPGAVTAATGQKEAPRPVVVDDADKALMSEALGKAKSVAPVAAAGTAAAAAAAAAGKAPVVVSPNSKSADNAAANTPVVVDALNAPDTVGNDASSVVVTDGSARSSSEDFATSVAAAAAAAAGKGPINNVGETTTSGGKSAKNDDDDDRKEMLAKLLVAGLGAYAVGKMIQNQGQVALNTGDRVVVQAPDGSQQIWRDDNALLLQPGARVTTENFTDGSSRSIITRDDGSRVVTIRDAQLRVLRRTLIAADGTATELINDAAPVEPVQVTALPPAARPVTYSGQSSESQLRDALEREAAVSRRFSLGQVRNISEVRSLVAPISIDSITFDTGSAAIRPDQAQQLSSLGKTIADMVKANPREVFMVEGYTDTVGQPASNLALSDRRAESLALALSEYFQVPPENLVVQGYGERFLKVQAEGDVRENRRVAVRRITNLLQN